MAAERKRVAIAGGGVAGVEALLALHDLAGDRTELSLVAPEPDFVYKPLWVEEPFGLGPAEQRALAPLAEQAGAELIQEALAEVDPDAHELRLGNGETVPYDRAVICVGGTYEPAFEGVHTFPSPRHSLTVEKLLTHARVSGGGSLVFVVPAGVVWSLPIYELALMTDSRARRQGYSDLKLRIVTPEASPLAVFGPIASGAVTELLEGRGIDFTPSTRVRQEDGALSIGHDGERVDPRAVIALPVMRGPAIDGLPSVGDGFIPIDDHARIRGVDDLYAAGDGTDFPIKQGGIATQQADAAAAHIAHSLGAAVETTGFHPVLRGQLLTGDESLKLKTDVAGGAGEGTVSADFLWWPPHKISGRYLAPWLYHGEQLPEAPGEAIEIEVDLPREWHEQPMALDPDGPPGPDAR